MQKTRTYRGDIVFSRKIARSPVITTRLKGGINPDVKYMKKPFLRRSNASKQSAYKYMICVKDCNGK